MSDDFKKLMLTRFLFSFATSMQAIVIGWQMYVLTHDPLHLGLLGLAEAIPAIGLSLYAGYIVDRSRPLFIYQNVLFGSFISALILLGSQFPHLNLSVHAQVVALFLSSFVTGTARGFSQPAIYAVVPRLVPREELTRASAWTTTAMQVARISGPGLGGLIFGWFGVAISAAVVSVTLVFGWLALFLIKQKVPPPEQKSVGKLKSELLSGLSFVFRNPILLPALSLDMLSVLFGGVEALLPIFADILGVGPKGLGILRASPAIGAVITSAWLSRVDYKKNAGAWLFTAVAGFGVCILIFGISTSFWISLAAITLSGAFDSVSMVIRGAAVQLSSPDHMRGRISAVNSIFIMSSNEIGEFESGVMAKLMGTVPSVVFGGVMCLLTVGVCYVFSPTLRKLNLETLAELDANAPN